MFQCISFKAASRSTSPEAINGDPLPQTSQANSADATTPASSSAAQPSPTVNLSHEFTHALQSLSYNEIYSEIHVLDPSQDPLQIQDEGYDRSELHLSQVLRPSRECVEEALSHAKQTSLANLIDSYFQHSENATSLCLSLYKDVRRARELYRPLCDLLEILPGDLHTISESQCNWAFNIFLQFDSFDNPFQRPESHNFREAQHCFSRLKQQLDSRLRKSRSRVRLLRRATAGSAVCLVGAVVVVAASAAVVASHALPTFAVVAGPLCSPYLPYNFKKKELANISQLDAAAKGTFVLNNDLNTIDCLVSRLQMAIEGDKLLIRLGLERGRDIYPVQEVVKQLRKNHPNFIDQLKDLEDHICLWFTNVNRARSLLLREIHLYRSYSS